MRFGVRWIQAAVLVLCSLSLSLSFSIAADSSDQESSGRNEVPRAGPPAAPAPSPGFDSERELDQVLQYLDKNGGADSDLDLRSIPGFKQWSAPTRKAAAALGKNFESLKASLNSESFDQQVEAFRKALDVMSKQQPQPQAAIGVMGAIREQLGQEAPPAPGGNGAPEPPKGPLADPDVARAVAEILPQDPGAHKDLSKALLGTGDPVGAALAAQKAVDLDPSDPGARSALSFAKFGQGDYAGAARAARQALALDPRDAAASSMLKLLGGRTAPSAEDAPSAAARAGAPPSRSSSDGFKATYSAASPENRLQAERLIADSQAYLKLGKTEKAMELAEEALRRDPSAAGALYQRAMGHILRQNLPEALKDVEAALRIDPRNDVLLTAHANILNRMKKYPAALFSANRALAIRPENADAFFNQAWALAGMGRDRAALRALARAAKLDPRYAREYRAALQLPDDNPLLDLFEPAAAAGASPERREESSSAPAVSWERAFLPLGLLLLVLALGLHRLARSQALPTTRRTPAR